MARAFDDLAADCSSDAEVEPRSTGEEMALHLAIARAQDLTRNRPRLVRDAVAGLPEERADFDWDACSDLLFQDHDVLMLFDPSSTVSSSPTTRSISHWAWSISLHTT